MYLDSKTICTNSLQIVQPIGINYDLNVRFTKYKDFIERFRKDPVDSELWENEEKLLIKGRKIGSSTILFINEI